MAFTGISWSQSVTVDIILHVKNLRICEFSILLCVCAFEDTFLSYILSAIKVYRKLYLQTISTGTAIQKVLLIRLYLLQHLVCH